MSPRRGGLRRAHSTRSSGRVEARRLDGRSGPDPRPENGLGGRTRIGTPGQGHVSRTSCLTLISECTTMCDNPDVDG